MTPSATGDKKRFERLGSREHHSGGRGDGTCCASYIVLAEIWGALVSKLGDHVRRECTLRFRVKERNVQNMHFEGGLVSMSSYSL